MNEKTLDLVDPNPYLKVVLQGVLKKKRISPNSQNMLGALFVFCNLTRIRSSQHLLKLLGDNQTAFVNLLVQASQSSNRKQAGTAISTLTNLLVDKVDPEIFMGSEFFECLGGLMWKGQHEDRIIQMLAAIAGHPDHIFIEELLGTVEIAAWIAKTCLAPDFPQKAEGLEFLRKVLQQSQLTAVIDFLIANQEVFSTLIFFCKKTEDRLTIGSLTECIEAIFSIGQSLEREQGSWNPFKRILEDSSELMEVIQELAEHSNGIIGEKFWGILEAMRKSDKPFFSAAKKCSIWD